MYVTNKIFSFNTSYYINDIVETIFEENFCVLILTHFIYTPDCSLSCQRNRCFSLFLSIKYDLKINIYSLNMYINSNKSIGIERLVC